MIKSMIVTTSLILSTLTHAIDLGGFPGGETDPENRVIQKELYEMCIGCSEQEARVKWNEAALPELVGSSPISLTGYIYTDTGPDNGYQWTAFYRGSGYPSVFSMVATDKANYYYQNMTGLKSEMLTVARSLNQSFLEMTNNSNGEVASNWLVSGKLNMITTEECGDFETPFAYWRLGTKGYVDNLVREALVDRYPHLQQFFENVARTTDIGDALTGLVEYFDNDDTIGINFENGGRLVWGWTIQDGEISLELRLGNGRIGYGLVDHNNNPVAGNQAPNTIINYDRNGHLSVVGSALIGNDCMMRDLADAINDNIHDIDMPDGNNFSSICNSPIYTNANGERYIQYEHTYWRLVARQGTATYEERTETVTLYLNTPMGEVMWSHCE